MSLYNLLSLTRYKRFFPTNISYKQISVVIFIYKKPKQNKLLKYLTMNGAVLATCQSKMQLSRPD